MRENETLINTIGDYVVNAFSKSTFRAISATLNADTGEVVLDMDLRNNSRAARHRVIDTVMTDVYPMFRPDKVTFTFMFTDHEGADAMNVDTVPELAVV